MYGLLIQLSGTQSMMSTGIQCLGRYFAGFEMRVSINTLFSMTDDYVVMNFSN